MRNPLSKYEAERPFLRTLTLKPRGIYRLEKTAKLIDPEEGFGNPRGFKGDLDKHS